MNSKTRKILRIAALVDILVGVGLLCAVLVYRVQIPVLVPVVLAISGLMIIAFTIVKR